MATATCGCPQLQSTDYHKTKHFRWWNVFDDMCRMARCWFERNRATFDNGMSRKLFWHFRSQWSTLTFISHICSPSYCYLALCLEVSMAFLFRENRRHGTDRQTDRQLALGRDTTQRKTPVTDRYCVWSRWISRRCRRDRGMLWGWCLETVQRSSRDTVTVRLYEDNTVCGLHHLYTETN